MLRRSADISPCGRYRYRLERHWNDNGPTCLFVMLNPSTADANVDDKTIQKCMTYAAGWGYGSLLVGNLFALRSTDRTALKKAVAAGNDPVGPENDSHLHELLEQAHLVVCGWGTDGALLGRDQEVLALLDGRGHALKETQDGHPNHPLYLKATLLPMPYGR